MKSMLLASLFLLVGPSINCSDNQQPPASELRTVEITLQFQNCTHGSHQCGWGPATNQSTKLQAMRYFSAKASLGGLIQPCNCPFVNETQVHSAVALNSTLKIPVLKDRKMIPFVAAFGNIITTWEFKLEPEIGVYRLALQRSKGKTSWTKYRNDI